MCTWRPPSLAGETPRCSGNPLGYDRSSLKGRKVPGGRSSWPPRDTGHAVDPFRCSIHRVAERDCLKNGLEMQEQAFVLCASGRVEGSGVPDYVVERGVPDAGELRLVAERYDDAPVEAGVGGVQVLCGDTVPAPRETHVFVVEGERPPAVEIDPLSPSELGTGILQSWLAARGGSSATRDGGPPGGLGARRSRGCDPSFPRREFRPFL
jgi:hypothetical protein